MDGRREEGDFEIGPQCGIGPNPVYDVFKPGHKTKWVYLYLITGPKVDAFEIKWNKNIDYNQVGNELTAILAEIAAGTLQPTGSGLGDIPWTHKSFIIVHFPAGKMNRGDAVRFTYLTPPGGNHSFHDGQDLPAGGGDVTTFFCLNHMQAHGGGDLGNISEKFCFELCHPEPSEHHEEEEGMGAKLLMFDHKDTGTNTGPPLP